MTAKKKYNLMKWLSAVGLPFYIFVVTAIAVLMNWDMVIDSVDKQTTITVEQWLIMVIYRLFLYIVPAAVLTFFRFDKRYKNISRFVIWLNWVLMWYLIYNLVINVLVLDKLLQLPSFNTVDAIIGLSGFVFTWIKKDKVEFANPETIIGGKL